MTPLTKTYQPHPLLRALYRYAFDRIQVEDAWLEKVREAASRGTVVYVLRNLNFIDFLALDHLTKRYGLPQVRFANDLGLGVLAPMGQGWLNALRPLASETDALREALSAGGSAALFLKRRPNVIDLARAPNRTRAVRAETQGSELVQTLIQVQQGQPAPLLLMPQVFVWTKRPDTLARGPMDALFGPREWPSPLRTAGQFLSNSKDVVLKAGEPLDLKEFLDKQGNVPLSVLGSRLSYAMLARLERERRSIVGPAGKPSDRVRDEILRSPRFLRDLKKLAKRSQTSESTLLYRSDALLSEMQAAPNGGIISAVDMLLQKVFHRIYAGIDIDPEGFERMRQAAKRGPIVLLPSHKSHVDYLILSYVFFHQRLPLPVIVAGDNLSFFPLGPLLRRAGGFFIRRSFQGDSLYPIVVEAYIRHLIREGFMVELFLEGGRSRDGKLLAPKFGILRMLVGASLASYGKQVQFVPISIGYERIVETGSFERELAGAEKAPEDAAGLLSAREVLRHRYGRINLQVGHILTLDMIKDELDIPGERPPSPKEVRSIVTRLGNRVMDEINRVTAVTPGSLTALALLTSARRGIPHDKLLRRCRRLLTVLQHVQARCTPALVTSSGELRPESIREAAQMFLDAELLEAFEPAAGDGAKPHKVRAGPEAIYSVPEQRRLSLDTVKNANIHLFVERSLVSCALLLTPEPVASRAEVHERVRDLSRLFKHEFRFRADLGFDDIFTQTLQSMQALGELQVTSNDSEALSPGAGHSGWTGLRWLATYAALLKSLLEGYRAVARSLEALLAGPLSEKDFTKRALMTGNLMYLGGEIDRKEAISKSLVSNAVNCFSDQRVLTRVDKNLALTEAYSKRDALVQLEANIAQFLEREVVA